MRRLLTALIAAMLLAPAAAMADGDPASDVLLGENVFYPYSPPVSASVQAKLNATAAAAARAKFPLKIALIASPVDLGVIPDLFGKPQQYADFLDQEISFQTHQPLLVVMSTGYGVQGLSAAAKAAVSSLAKPASGQSTDLAKAAITAVEKLAAASGHPVAASARGSSGTSGSSTRTLVLIGLAVAAVATAATLVVLRRRNATT